MFGNNFEFVQPPKKAECGEHEVIIKNVAERKLSGFNVLTFSFEYADKVERVPNTFDLFDVVNPYDQKQLAAFNVKLSKIMLCFGMEREPNWQNYALWAGKRGKVVITRSEKGFLNVTDFVARK